ncbi:hypothetical protein ACLMJK_006919 [Lecanora helva]
MSTVGPELPPHLQAKRKHSDADDDSSTTPPKRARSSSSEDKAPQRRIIGPAAPPAPLAELPTTAPDSDAEDNSSSDDDFGPSLPPAPNSANYIAESKRQQDLHSVSTTKPPAGKPQREEWMLVPPKQDDWSSRVDPTKLRNRKFQTGKGAKAPSQAPGGHDSNNALWTETPEQKRQRLEDEVLGVKKPAQLGPPEKAAEDRLKEQEARKTQERIREYNEKNRQESLFAEHGKKAKKEKEDDPSKRAFDREKDMGLGVKVGERQRREMVSKARDFGSRFAGGSYL